MNGPCTGYGALAVDQLLAIAPTAEVVDVPNGKHGFDMLDHTDESRRAVRAALGGVVRLLQTMAR